MRSASADEGVVGKGERFRLAVGDERERGFGFVDFMLVETDRLVEAIRTRGFEASFLELLDSIGLRLAKTLAAGVAPFERIIRKEFDVRPPGIAVEV